MSEGNNFSHRGEAVTLSRKSWIAFLGPVLACSITLVVAVPLLARLFSWPVAMGAAAFVIAYFGYRMLMVQSVRLYVDDAGVWVFAGVVPGTAVLRA